MSQFSSWFNRCYIEWTKSQPGDEDFLAFCDLLGYSASKILSWLEGETEPRDAELLSIAGLFGMKVYSLLNQPEPDPELLNIYCSFPHLSGDNRSRVATAILEAQKELKDRGILANSAEAKKFISQVFFRWGFSISADK